MRKQHRRVYQVCTEHISDLSGGSHDDVLLAADWIGACLAAAPSLQRKWTRKLAGKLAKAKAWEERVAAEAAAASQDGGAPSTCDRTYNFCANRCSAAHCITVRSCIDNCMAQQRFDLEDCPPSEEDLLQCVP